MKLNIGSGYRKIEGFTNVDKDPLCNPDIIADLEDLHLPIEDSTVEYVIAHHVLEHIGVGYLNLMKEIYRVCKHEAIFEIKVPHHRSEEYFGDPTHVRPVTVQQMKLFSKKYCENHIKQYGSSSGVALPLNVDFEIVDFFTPLYPKWQERFQTMSEEEINEVIENFNNVFYETQIRLMVIKE